jgi:hypothetical protein
MSSTVIFFGAWRGLSAARVRAMAMWESLTEGFELGKETTDFSDGRHGGAAGRASGDADRGRGRR